MAQASYRVERITETRDGGFLITYRDQGVQRSAKTFAEMRVGQSFTLSPSLQIQPVAQG